MKRLLLFLVSLAALAQFACKKSESGTPVVTHVRLVDPTKADSFFTQAKPGTLIDIQGSGFSGLQAVYFNDTSAYFNPVYATNNNIIISIPGYAQTSATKSNATNTIRIVTAHGSVTYSFRLVLDAPVITSITLDNTGKLLYINGTNLLGVQKITFPVPNPDTALSYKVDTSGRLVTAVIPPGNATHDSIRVYCTFGVASFPYPPPMTIASVSNENAIAGDTILISGTNFSGITSVTFPGNIVVNNPTVLNIGQMTVVVPAGITAPDSLRIAGALGMATAPQLFDSYITHPSPGYLSTFDVQYTSSSTDNNGFVGWTGGYAGAPASAYPNATGGVAFLANGSPIAGNTGGGSQGNAGFIQLYDVPWVANTGDNVSGYSLKFEVYVKSGWKAGAIYVMMGDWYGWKGYLARYAPWSTDPNGNFQPSGWVTATIPLSQMVSTTGPGTSVMANGKVASPNNDANEWDYQTFPTGGMPATTFANYNATSLCFSLVNDQASPSIPANALNIAIDNVRIVKGQ
ncbi:MAG TPA: glycan-binding surface protein [Puia sp.]|nr:glycan-binding surface protein [Puia sp.]